MTESTPDSVCVCVSDDIRSVSKRRPRYDFPVKLLDVESLILR